MKVTSWRSPRLHGGRAQGSFRDPLCLSTPRLHEPAGPGGQTTLPSARARVLGQEGGTNVDTTMQTGSGWQKVPGLLFL